MNMRRADNNIQRVVGGFYEGKFNGYMTICFVVVDKVSEGCQYKISEGYWKMDKEHGKFKIYFRK